jgi:hypothetical protein
MVKMKKNKKYSFVLYSNMFNRNRIYRTLKKKILYVYIYIYI